MVGPQEGSSPLARGKPQARPQGSDPRRIIPACAGETLTDHHRLAVLWDHPRLRGGNEGCAHLLGGGGGSSPLARGKQHAVSVLDDELGIIPACAGETLRSRPRTP